MKLTSNPNWFKESDDTDFMEDELDTVESEELDEPENEEDALALSEANGETYVDDEGNERYVGNHHLVDKNKQAPTPAKKEQPKEQPKDIKQIKSAYKELYTDMLTNDSYDSKEAAAKANAIPALNQAKQNPDFLDYLVKKTKDQDQAHRGISYWLIKGMTQELGLKEDDMLKDYRTYDGRKYRALDPKKAAEAIKEKLSKEQEQPKNLYTSFRDDLDKLTDENPDWSNSKLIKEVTKKYADQYKDDPDKLTKMANYFKRLLSGN